MDWFLPALLRLFATLVVGVPLTLLGLYIAATLYDTTVDAKTSTVLPDHFPRLVALKKLEPDKKLDEALRTFDKTIRNAPKGQTYFVAPESVPRYGEFEVSVVLGPKDKEAALEKAVKNLDPQGVGSFATKEVPILRSMSALVTGDRFTVSPVTPASQAPSGQQPTTWRWAVSSKEVGTWKLSYAIAGQLTADKDGPSRLLDDGGQEIEVRMDPIGFVKDNWAIFVTAILVPLAVWVWKLLTGKGRTEYRD